MRFDILYEKRWITIGNLISSLAVINAHWVPYVFVLFVWFDALRPINNLSVKLGWVFLGWTSTKLGEMCLAQGPQLSDAGKAWTWDLSVVGQALYHWATTLPPYVLFTLYGILVPSPSQKFIFIFIGPFKMAIMAWPCPSVRPSFCP